MGYDKKKLKEPMKPLYGSGGKRIESIRVITLPISFGTPQKPRTEYITFNMVNMLYPYNVIFERGLLNNLKAALHSGYLCFKIPATFSIITVFGNQKEARSIERGFALGHKSLHFTRGDVEQHKQAQPSSKQEISAEFKKAIEVEGDFNRVALNPRVPNKIVCTGAEMSPEEQAELLQFLNMNSDIFAWSTSDLVGVSREVIEHKLQVNPHAMPKKQKLRKMTEEKIETVKAEVPWLLDAEFIREVRYL
jgi:hypothetical protein